MIEAERSCRITGETTTRPQSALGSNACGDALSEFERVRATAPAHVQETRRTNHTTADGQMGRDGSEEFLNKAGQNPSAEAPDGPERPVGG
jgi:hypothetical protein